MKHDDSDIEEDENDDPQVESSEGDTESDEIPEDPELYCIHDSRDRFIRFFMVSLFVMLTSVVIVVTLYFQAYFAIRDPEPTFSTTEILDGFRHDFFHEAKSFNETQKICSNRNSELIVFNNTEEHSRFNQFVVDYFQPYIYNNTDKWKRIGLQIWTGIRIIFKGGQLTQFDWHGKTESSGTVERMQQIRKAMQNKYASKQFIVKDFTTKAENEIKESGCWQIRFLEGDDSLILPFVCKSRINP